MLFSVHNPRGIQKRRRGKIDRNSGGHQDEPVPLHAKPIQTDPVLARSCLAIRRDSA